jgi:type II restriction enzyme
MRPKRRSKRLGKEAGTSWTAEVLRCVRKLPKKFQLSDVYKFEGELLHRFPRNQHVREKIRQQLQVLRDRGLITFVDQRGHYLAR